MPRQKKYPDGYVATGVVFEPEVIAYVKQLAREEERNQSTVINRIIRDYAERRGEPLPRKKVIVPLFGADEVKT